MNRIIQKLEAQIEENNKIQPHHNAECSWGDQWGVILSTDEARKVLIFLKSVRAEFDKK